MSKNNILLFHDVLEKYHKLTDAQFGVFVRSLLLYSKTGEQPDIADAAVSIAFDSYKVIEDINKIKWLKTSEERKKAAVTRWNKDKEAHAIGCKCSVCNAKHADTVTVTVKGSVKQKKERNINTPQAELCNLFKEQYQLAYTNNTYLVDQDDYMIMAKLLKSVPAAEIEQKIKSHIAAPPDWIKGLPSIKTFRKSFNSIQIQTESKKLSCEGRSLV